MRGLLSELRDGGKITGSPVTFNKKDHQAFANQLDSFFNKTVKNRKRRKITDRIFNIIWLLY